MLTLQRKEQKSNFVNCYLCVIHYLKDLLLNTLAMVSRDGAVGRPKLSCATREIRVLQLQSLAEKLSLKNTKVEEWQQLPSKTLPNQGRSRVTKESENNHSFYLTYKWPHVTWPRLASFWVRCLPICVLPDCSMGNGFGSSEITLGVFYFPKGIAVVITFLFLLITHILSTKHFEWCFFAR